MQLHLYQASNSFNLYLTTGTTALVARKSITSLPYSDYVGKIITVAFKVDSTTTQFKWSDYIGQVIEIAFKIDATTGALTFYLNGNGYTTSSTGTLTAPSLFSTAATDYIFSVGGVNCTTGIVAPISATFFDLFIINRAYTVAECLANQHIINARWKFNEASGNVLYNTGISRGEYNLTCSGITETAFHTLVKES